MTGSSYVLSEDRREMTITTFSPKGTLTTIITWDHPATQEEVQIAQDYPISLDTFGIELGESRFAQRWRRKRGSWWLHISTGPPTWWWPRIIPERWGLMVGWYRGCISFTWKTSEKDRKKRTT